jgi:2-dehydropantoate 2-reductase
MRILVIGAGSVGGYFGGRLAAAGRDVTFMVRAARQEQLRRDGLQIVSQHGDLTLAPKTVLANEIDGPYDVILFGVKAYTLEAAIEDFAPAVGPETMIVPLLNGMRHLDILVARFGEAAVLGGTTRISTDLDKDGRILQMGSLQDFSFGERDGSITPRVKALEATLTGAGFDEKLSNEIIRVMWQKWVILASMASITCLMRGSIGAVAAVPQGAATAHAIVDECAAIVSAEGYAPSAAALEGTHARLTEKGSDLTASMYRDLKKGAPVEVEHVIGDLLGRGAARGVESPLLRAAYAQLAVYQAQR